MMANICFCSTPVTSKKGAIFKTAMSTDATLSSPPTSLLVRSHLKNMDEELGGSKHSGVSASSVLAKLRCA